MTDDQRVNDQLAALDATESDLPSTDDLQAHDEAEEQNTDGDPGATEFGFGAKEWLMPTKSCAEADATRRAFGTKPPEKLKPATQDNLFNPLPQGRLF